MAMNVDRNDVGLDKETRKAANLMGVGQGKFEGMAPNHTGHPRNWYRTDQDHDADDRPNRRNKINKQIV